MCFRHVPEQVRKKLDDQSEVLVLIGYHSIGAYKLFSPIKNKLVISKDGLEDESKRWDWSRSSVRQESDTVTSVFKEDEQNEASTSRNEQGDTLTGRNEEPIVQNERRSTRTRTELTRLIRYERFLDQAIDVDGDLIEALSEALSNSNWCEAMK